MCSDAFNCLEYYIKTYSQVILQFTEMVQGLNEEEKGTAADTADHPKNWTLRFSVRDIAGHEAYLREGEQKNVDFINVVKGALAEAYIKPNNFQVPLLGCQFALFHGAAKKAYVSLFPGKKFEVQKRSHTFVGWDKQHLGLFHAEQFRCAGRETDENVARTSQTVSEQLEDPA